MKISFFYSNVFGAELIPTTFIITMTSQWAGWRLKSPASRLFTQPLHQVQVKETSKPRFTGPCVGNSPGTVKFPAHVVSNAETVSIWWRHHESIALNWYLPFQVGPYISLHWSQISIMAHQLTGNSVVCSKVCAWPPTPKNIKVPRQLSCCEANPLATGGFPARRTSNGKSVCIS